MSNLVPLRRTGLRVCGECQSVTTELVAPGQHAPHWAGGVLVNCAGTRLGGES